MEGGPQPDSLHAYYTARGLSPTDCRFASRSELDRYAAGRTILFRDRLKLPPALFDGARVVEVGPDTGENALVFAQWGARLVLVEPNEQAHSRIHANFDQFDLGGRMEALLHQDVENFRATEPADFITAEGFIYTCRPVEPWMRTFAHALKPDGFVVMSYYERIGATLELVTKMLAARVRTLTGEDSISVAERLYGPKWRTIGHTRRFDSWVMDVLDNPFVRHAWFFDAAELCRDMEGHGFALYSAWPGYVDGLAVHWHKRVPMEGEEPSRREIHLARTCISLMVGRPLYLAGDSGAIAGALEAVRQFGIAIDKLVEGFDEAAAKRARQMLDRLLDSVSLGTILPHDPNDIDLACDLFRALRAALVALEQQDADAVTRITTENRAFLSLWGAPAHYAVFRRTAVPI